MEVPDDLYWHINSILLGFWNEVIGIVQFLFPKEKGICISNCGN